MATTPNPTPRNNGRSTLDAATEAFAAGWEAVQRTAASAAEAIDGLRAAHDDATDPRANPCPECLGGEVIPDGPMEADTGHQPYRCSVRCGWSA